MYYRVRTTLPDAPGALAMLAKRCGHAEVNILGLQIYPDLGTVTDDLVLSVPESWPPSRVVELVESAGGSDVTVVECTAHELRDQPTRWLTAVRSLIDDPSRLTTEITALVGPRVRLSATERARVAALTDIVAALGDTPTPARVSAEVVAYEETDVGVNATVGDGVIGAAHLTWNGSDTVVEGRVEVAPAWRRIGVGRQLLRRVCQVAARAGARELLVLAPPSEEGLVPLLAATGLRGRIRLSAEGLEVRIGLEGVLPASASAHVPD